jgi:hypothetical protein
VTKDGVERAWRSNDPELMLEFVIVRDFNAANSRFEILACLRIF